MSDRFNEFLSNNREQPRGPVNIRESIAKTREKKSQRGAVPYISNAVNAVNRGVTQIAETPYNIVNRVPQLINLLPGEQGVGSIDEMAAEASPGMVKDVLTSVFPSKDPLIDFMEEHHPGLNAPNSNYPVTNQIGEDIGIGVSTLGMAGPVSMLKGPIGRGGKYVFDAFKAAPKTAIASEVAGSIGAAGGRYAADELELGPIGSFAAEAIGAIGPASLAYSVPQAAQTAFGRKGGLDTLEAMERLNIRPSAGVTGSQTMSQLENGAAIVPVLGSAAKKVQTQQLGEFGDVMIDAAAKVRPKGAIPNTGEIMLGEQVRDISEQGLQRMKAGFGGREDAMMNAIGPRTLVDVSNTRKAIEDLIPRVDPELQDALMLELEILDRMMSAGQAGVPYEQLRSFRTNVGRRTNQPSIGGGLKKKIYAGLTDDTQVLADSAGVGDDFTKLMSDQATAYDDTARLVDGGDIPAMEKLASSQNETGRNFFKQGIKNPDRLDLLKRNATDEQWSQFAGDTMEYLGLAKDSAQGAAGREFSPNTFLTNWNQMDPRSKLILFDDDLGTLQTLDDLAVVAEGLQRRGNASNFSNTAGVGMSAAAITGTGAPIAAGNVSGALAGAGMSYVAIKGLMSETLAKWAAGRTPTIQNTVGRSAPAATYRGVTDGPSEQENQ